MLRFSSKHMLPAPWCFVGLLGKTLPGKVPRTHCQLSMSYCPVHFVHVCKQDIFMAPKNSRCVCALDKFTLYTPQSQTRLARTCTMLCLGRSPGHIGNSPCVPAVLVRMFSQRDIRAYLVRMYHCKAQHNKSLFVTRHFDSLV